MRKNILYVANYYLRDVIEQRHSEAFISQAGQNKGKYIMDLLTYAKNDILVWSNAWTSSRSFRFYRGFRSELNPNIYYSSIFGAPALNALTCYWSSRRFLKKYLKKNHLDAIIIYNMRLENSLLAFYAKRRFGIPVILQYEDGLTTDAHISKLKRLVYGRMEKKLMKCLDGALLVNSKIEVPCPAVVIRGVIRPEMGDNVKKHDSDSGIPKLLFASTLDEQRGVMVLLEALKHTKEKFVLTITGRGDAERLIRECGDERVRFLGYLDYEDYRRELSEADVCINAQLAGHEFAQFSFPSKIFEYLSAGKLVISSDMADVEESLGNAVLVYHNDSPEELAETIENAIRVKKNPELYREYEKAIRVVIEDNSMEKVSARMDELLDEVRR